MVISKSQLSTFLREFKEKIKTTIIDISCKFYLQNNDVTYTYCINLAEATIRHQKLILTYRELPIIALS